MTVFRVTLLQLDFGLDYESLAVMIEESEEFL